MTTIHLITSDQHLVAVQKVKLASGDVNSVKLNVSFDNMWDRYGARTAVFYTSKDSTRYEVLLIDDECVVPEEVLANEAVLYIGIRAATTDGTAIKTSSVVQLKIVQGVNAAETTISPTMDLFQQYLAALDSKVAPIRLDVDSQLETFMSQLLQKNLNMQFIKRKGDGNCTESNPIYVDLEFEPDVVLFFDKGNMAVFAKNSGAYVKNYSYKNVYDDDDELVYTRTAYLLNVLVSQRDNGSNYIRWYSKEDTVLTTEGIQDRHANDTIGADECFNSNNKWYYILALGNAVEE